MFRGASYPCRTVLCGVKKRDDVEKLISVGVRAVLIGQTLCESDDIEKKFVELFGDFRG